MIKSPYNFVPLSEKVYYPEWGELVSHDIPFEDGESGEIKVQIDAKTPLFVRNGSAEHSDKFSNVNGKYFIPGTSIKGMIRNVMEILSAGKMQLVDDRRFTWRELRNKNGYTDKFVKDFVSQPLVQSGFINIDKETGKYVLTPCTFARIEQCDLDKKMGVDQDKLSGPDKYKYWAKENNSLEQTFYITGPSTSEFKKQCGSFRRAWMLGSQLPPEKSKNAVKVDGQIVFTGQIGPRKSRGEGEHGTGKKHLEFVFFDKESSKKFTIPEKMFKDFELNHSEERNKERHSNALAPNAEWGYWKEKLESGQAMPVFWLGNENKVDSFGMAMLYRLPLKYSVHDELPIGGHTAHISKETGRFIEENFKPDMVDTLFGYTVSQKSLRGRIQFSHAFLEGAPKVLETKSEVLGSPKPTFYPNYLKTGTYNEKGGIAGWKRYPVHKSVKKSINATGNKKIETQFTPLAASSTFTLKIRFHNLKKIEIGALISALTFHRTENCYHALGMAKSLGYGKVKIDILKTSNLKHTEDEYLKAFEKEMAIKVHGGVYTKPQVIWYKQLQELIAMASEPNQEADEKLVYMELNEFQRAKIDKKHLQQYSKYSEIDKQINRYVSEDEITQALQEFSKNEKERIRQAQEKKLKDEKQKKVRLEEEEQARKQKVVDERKAEEQRQKDALKLKVLEEGLDKPLNNNNVGGVISDVIKFIKERSEKTNEPERLSNPEKEKVFQKLLTFNDKKSKKKLKKKDEMKKVKSILGDDLSKELVSKL